MNGSNPLDLVRDEPGVEPHPELRLHFNARPCVRARRYSGHLAGLVSLEFVGAGFFEARDGLISGCFVTAEAARAGVELRDLQAEIKRRQQNDVSATMDPLIDVEG